MVTEAPHSGPRLSVVVEGSLWEQDASIGLADVLRALARQTLPSDQLEVLVVVQEGGEAAIREVIEANFPQALVVSCTRGEYFPMKNAGAAEARSRIVAFLDSDTIPVDDWCARIVATIEAGAAMSTGRVRYPPGTRARRLLEFVDFGNTFAGQDGQATGLQGNNVAFDAGVFADHGFDQRVRRTGACYLLFNRLRDEGYQLAYDAGQAITHVGPGPGSRLPQRLRHGYDSVMAGRLGNGAEHRALRAHPRSAPLFIYRDRAVHDLRTLLRRRQELGISWVELPMFEIGILALRAVELLGAFATLLRPRWLEQRYGW